MKRILRLGKIWHVATIKHSTINRFGPRSEDMQAHDVMVPAILRGGPFDVFRGDRVTRTYDRLGGTVISLAPKVHPQGALIDVQWDNLIAQLDVVLDGQSILRGDPAEVASFIPTASKFPNPMRTKLDYGIRERKMKKLSALIQADHARLGSASHSQLVDYLKSKCAMAGIGDSQVESARRMDTDRLRAYILDIGQGQETVGRMEKTAVRIADFHPGDEVFYRRYGRGQVLQVHPEENVLIVQFESAGRRALDPRKLPSLSKIGQTDQADEDQDFWEINQRMAEHLPELRQSEVEDGVPKGQEIDWDLVSQIAAEVAPDLAQSYMEHVQTLGTEAFLNSLKELENNEKSESQVGQSGQVKETVEERGQGGYGTLAKHGTEVNPADALWDELRTISDVEGQLRQAIYDALESAVNAREITIDKQPLGNAEKELHYLFQENNPIEFNRKFDQAVAELQAEDQQAWEERENENAQDDPTYAKEPYPGRKK